MRTTQMQKSTSTFGASSFMQYFCCAVVILAGVQKIRKNPSCNATVLSTWAVRLTFKRTESGRCIIMEVHIPNKVSSSVSAAPGPSLIKLGQILKSKDFITVNPLHVTHRPK